VNGGGVLAAIPAPVRGLAVAGAALLIGWWLGLVVPDRAVGWAAGLAVSLALLLGWLLWPAPAGGGATLGGLLSPMPDQPIWVAAVFTLGWSVLALAGAGLVVGAAGFDLDARDWRPASAWEIGWSAVAGLLLATFHGLFCLGWGMGRGLRDGVAPGVLLQAAALGAALPVVFFAPMGFALFGVIIGLMLTGPATLAMALVVLFGGRAWPVILVNAAAWAVASLSIEIPLHD
jgi:hypothetical protein